ncbi:M15 family metallopeptidase [Marmoricola sp. Leaf446]|uniref:M15 family metallopeptidase n=1 Tax=Marmoricola sp. Leaf446 TaxID=1736379 RepID=UPI000AAFAED6|nr:M15 family metallopeptidase [Marmoricola sp. Leaf446]
MIVVRRAAAALVAAALAMLAACGGTDPPEATPTPSPTTSPSSPAPTSPAPSTSPTDTPTRTPAPDPAPGTVPPAWLGTRVLPLQENGFGVVRPTPPELRVRRFTLPDTLGPLPGRGFASRVVSPTPQRVVRRSTWRPGCPVGPADLAWVRLTFRGFDGERHTGELLVAARVAEDLVGVFRRLWEARFPMEELRITRRDELDAPPTGDGNTTGALACRPVRGSSVTSQHALGLAVDVNPFQNPYRRGDDVLPELASAYLDRDRVRPGVITPDGPVVAAFAAIGWEWGGDWRTLEDYQHFSENGR